MTPILRIVVPCRRAVTVAWMQWLFAGVAAIAATVLMLAYVDALHVSMQRGEEFRRIQRLQVATSAEESPHKPAQRQWPRGG